MLFSPPPSQKAKTINPLASAVVCVDLDALSANYRALQSLVGLQSEIGPVLKSNAYGLGMLPVAKALKAQGAQRFFVATIEEGLLLRQADPHSTIYLLNNLWPEAMEEALAHNLTPILSSIEQITNWNMLAKKTQKLSPFWIQVDTGLKRLGLSPQEAKELASDSTLTPSVQGILSHLACSYETHNPFNGEQQRNFHQLSSLFPRARCSLANSGGALLGPEYHYDLVRPGRFLYGDSEKAGHLSHKLSHIIELKTRILQIQTIKPGETVGYERTFKAQKHMRLATCGVGYGDGYFQSFSNKAYGLIETFKTPVVGKVSMDLITLDVSDVPEKILEKSAWISLINQHITMETLAKWAQINVWEMLTHLGKRATFTYEHRTIGEKNS